MTPIPLASLGFSSVFDQLVKSASPFHSFRGLVFVSKMTMYARRNLQDLQRDFLLPIFKKSVFISVCDSGKQCSPQLGLLALCVSVSVPRAERPPEAPGTCPTTAGRLKPCLLVADGFFPSIHSLIDLVRL